MDFITLLAILVALYLWYRRTDSNLPPIPRIRLPIVGNLLSLGEDPIQAFKKWRGEYGDVFSVFMGQKLVIIVNGYEAIQEALVQRADDFSHRPPMFVDTITGIPRKGILANSGPDWKKQRSTVVSILHKLSSGQNKLAQKIQEEVSFYLDLLGNLEGKPTNIAGMLNISISNVIFSIITGRRFTYDDPTFKEMTSMLTFNFENGKTLVTLFPILHHLPGDFFQTKEIESNAHRLMEMMREKFIEKHGEGSIDKTKTDDFVSTYLREIEEKTEPGQSVDQDDETLVKILLELFESGNETASTPILWCVLYLLRHPDVQEKVYEEIKREIGTKRPPTINDKQKLTYLNAVTMETLRLCSLVPLGVPHACPHDVTFRGYKIPRGADVLFNIKSVLHDPNVWGEDVLSFKPERFIADNGRLTDPKEFIPFSIGRRYCMGESLAQMEMFLYVSSMIQRFKLEAPVPDSPPPMDTKFGFLTTPADFQVKVVERLPKN